MSIALRRFGNLDTNYYWIFGYKSGSGVNNKAMKGLENTPTR